MVVGWLLSSSFVSAEETVERCYFHTAAVKLNGVEYPVRNSIVSVVLGCVRSPAMHARAPVVQNCTGFGTALVWLPSILFAIWECSFAFPLARSILCWQLLRTGRSTILYSRCCRISAVCEHTGWAHMCGSCST